MPLGPGSGVNGPLSWLRPRRRGRRARRGLICDGSPVVEDVPRLISGLVGSLAGSGFPCAASASAAVGRCATWWLLAVAASFTLTVAGQSVRAEAPWLTVYDEAGRPKWEVRMEVLVRTDDGWEGQAVQVQLYHEGVPHLVLRAPHIRADRYGREWSLLTGEPGTGQPIVGEGEGFSFTCREARWRGGLVLVDLTAEGRDLVLAAAEARWQLGVVVHLVGAEVAFKGWQLRFKEGQYDLTQDVLLAEAVTVTGHGVTLAGAALTAWPNEGRLRVTGAHLAQAP